MNLLLRQNFAFLCLLAVVCSCGIPGANGQLSRITDWFSRLFDNMFPNTESDTLSVQCNVDGSLAELMPDVRNLDRTLEEVAWCYMPLLGHRRVDIFNGSINFKSICMEYYVSAFR